MLKGKTIAQMKKEESSKTTERYSKSLNRETKILRKIYGHDVETESKLKSKKSKQTYQRISFNNLDDNQNFSYIHNSNHYYKTIDPISIYLYDNTSKPKINSKRKTINGLNKKVGFLLTVFL